LRRQHCPLDRADHPAQRAPARMHRLGYVLSAPWTFVDLDPAQSTCQ
jgi:hypothetical protein